MKRILLALLFSGTLWGQATPPPDTALTGTNQPATQTIVPPPAPDAPPYTFNPLSVKRDPFQAPDFKSAVTQSELQRYDLNEMNLVAILTGMGRPQAMIVLPSGKTHIVQVGDQMGRHNGRISKISDNEIVVRETFKDYQN